MLNKFNNVFLIFVFLISTVYIAFGQENRSLMTISENESIFKVVEDMPRFPGCEDIDGRDERKECAQGKMLDYIYENLKYPQEALDLKKAGMLVLQFIVDKEGGIQRVNIVRKLGFGMDEAAVNVIESMNNMPERWICGKQRNNPVHVLYTLPIKFKIDKDKK